MPGCNKRYTDPSSLRKHVRTHGHYYRENERQLSKTKSAFSSNIPSAPMSPSGLQHLHHSPSHPAISSPPISRLLALSPGSVIPHTLSPHMLPVHNMMHVTNFPSNPLLSSTMLSPLVTTQTTSTQTEGMITSLSPISPIKLNLSNDKSPDDSDEKCQDGPLDLTTNTSSEPDTEMDDSDRDNANFPSSKWELIHS